MKPASVDIGFTFQTQQADAQVLVNDGETIVMGGLTETDLTVTKTGIPFLVDLPIIGRLFGFTSADGATARSHHPDHAAHRGRPGDAEQRQLARERICGQQQRQSGPRGSPAAPAAVWACETGAQPGRCAAGPHPAHASSLTTVAATRRTSRAGCTFTVNASDNLALRTVRLTYTGGYVAGPIDTTFTGQVPTVELRPVDHVPGEFRAPAGNVQHRRPGHGRRGELHGRHAVHLPRPTCSRCRCSSFSPRPAPSRRPARACRCRSIAVQSAGIRKIGFLGGAGRRREQSRPAPIRCPFPIPLPDSVNAHRHTHRQRDQRHVLRRRLRGGFRRPPRHDQRR